MSGESGELENSHWYDGSTLKAIDLFAGIGGIRKGFEAAFRRADGTSGIKTVLASEIDGAARRSYRANEPKDEHVAIVPDVTAIKTDESLPNFDICLAGFPCQAFSLAGKRMGFDDPTKGTLFFDVKRLCKAKLPKIIFCENVKGLVGHNKGKTFKVIEESFEDMGYKLYWNVLNSKNFGVAQNRERIYLVGIRKDLIETQESLGLYPFTFPTHYGKQIMLRDILQKDVPYRYYMSEQYFETLKRHRARHQAKGNGFGYVIRKPDEVAGTLVCGGMGKERNLIREPMEVFEKAEVENNDKIQRPKNREGVRMMTPQEWALLQGYENFNFSDENGSFSDGALYRQFGNTVTVTVIEAIAKKIRDYLSQFKSEKLEISNVPVENGEQLRWIFMNRKYSLPTEEIIRVLKTFPTEGESFYFSIGKQLNNGRYVSHGLCKATFREIADQSHLKAIHKYATDMCHDEYAVFDLVFLSEEAYYPSNFEF